MTRNERHRLRAALEIHERLSRARSLSPPPLLPLDDWRNLCSATRRVVLAQERGWTNAALAARDDYRHIAISVADRLTEIARSLNTAALPPRVQSPQEILADIAAVEAEFAEVELDLRDATLELTTDPVVLESIDLGRFQIRLHWSQLPDRGAYEVIALDPNPAGSEETTTHPHVRDDALCEGEGRIPIRRTLQEGRLFDFALLVRSVLTTYNPGSAYVPLSRWHGSSCTDCGYLSSDDESTSCEACGSDLCFDCSTACADCSRSCCSECRDRCSGCDESHCTRCLKSCADCGESYCRSCLSAGLCSNCQESDDSDDVDSTRTINTNEKETDDSDNHTFPKETAPLSDEPPLAPLHPVRVGEAAVSA